MHTPSTITAAQFAGLARDHLQSVLDPALADRVFDFVLAAEAVPAGDEATADHVRSVMMVGRSISPKRSRRRS